MGGGELFNRNLGHVVGSSPDRRHHLGHASVFFPFFLYVSSYQNPGGERGAEKTGDPAPVTPALRRITQYGCSGRRRGHPPGREGWLASSLPEVRPSVSRRVWLSECGLLFWEAPWWSVNYLRQRL